MRTRRPRSAPPATSLVLGGAGPDQLSEALRSLTTSPERTFCAVASTEEATAAIGLARVELFDPWPGRPEALVRLAAAAAPLTPEAPVVVIAAGTAFRPGFLRRALRHVRRGVALVVAAPEAQPGRRARSRIRGRELGLGALGARVMARAVVRPGSGMVLRADVLQDVLARGWAGGETLTLGDLQERGGVRVVRGGLVDHRPQGPAAGRRMTVTVLIPAHDEQAWIGETLRSLKRQTRMPDEIIVVDDRSTDETGSIARALGATVIRTEQPKLRAGACNVALPRIATDAVITIDADTVLDPAAIEHIMAGLEGGLDATNGSVMPQVQRGLWSRGRVVEYALAMRLYKRAQRALGTVVVMSGCISAFRTDILREVGGFPHRTLTEDLDLTWMLHELGYRIGYTPEAIGYPAEPDSWRLYKAQMRRWAGGFYQSIRVHGRDLRRRPALALMLFAAVWDVLLPLVLMGVLFVLVLLKGFDGAGLRPELHIVLFWQAIVLGVPLILASTVVGVRRALLATPAYAVISLLAQYFYTEAFIREFVLRKRDMQWVKGH